MVKHIRAFLEPGAQCLTPLEGIQEFLQQLFLHTLGGRFNLNLDRAIQRQSSLEQHRHLSRESQDILSVNAIFTFSTRFSRGYLAQ